MNLEHCRLFVDKNGEVISDTKPCNHTVIKEALTIFKSLYSKESFDGFLYLKFDPDYVLFKEMKDNKVLVAHYQEEINPLKINTMLSLS